MTFSNLEKTWRRPSLIIFAENPPEEGTNENAGKWQFTGDVLYLTDDNRSALSVNPIRIENKRRMIDGTMRSVWVNDKKEFSTSWSNIPSRKLNGSDSITSDSFGAGLDIKNWYDSYTGDFWVMFVYDTNDSDDVDTSVELYNVFISSFDYDVVKRGQYNDLWDVSLSLVEV